MKILSAAIPCHQRSDFREVKAWGPFLGPRGTLCGHQQAEHQKAYSQGPPSGVRQSQGLNQVACIQICPAEQPAGRMPPPWGWRPLLHAHTCPGLGVGSLEQDRKVWKCRAWEEKDQLGQCGPCQPQLLSPRKVHPEPQQLFAEFPQLIEGNVVKLFGTKISCEQFI